MRGTLFEMKHTSEELSQIFEDSAWWQELAANLGWRLTGFSLRRSAFFIDDQEQSVHLTGSQRDDIMRKIG